MKQHQTIFHTVPLQEIKMIDIVRIIGDKNWDGNWLIYKVDGHNDIIRQFNTEQLLNNEY
ncbi:MAG: hypothetical protein C5B43_02320 [Verrucomicrobia bacterium]|nr:MAG: hypothetical protein C5B43_02320 [Verrucomicrobiota bacterium]